MTFPKGKILWSIAGGCAALILIVLGASFWVFEYGNPFVPSRLPALPAESTALLFEGMTSDAWARITPTLPTLPSLPSPAPVDGAIAILPDKSLSWIVMDPATHQMQGSQAALSLLTRQSESVLRNPLIMGASDQSTWVAVAPALLPKDELPKNAAPGLMRLDLSTGVTLSWMGSDFPHPAAETVSLPGASDSVFVNDPQSLWNGLSAVLPSSRMLVLQALLQTASQKMLPDISPGETVLPLFSKSLTVATKKTGSGESVLLFGEGDKPVTTEMMKALHQAVITATPPTQRLQAHTKEGFDIDTLVPLTEKPVTTQRTLADWSIMETMSGDAPVLLTAASGNRLIIATDQTLFEEALQAARMPQSEIAKGSVSPSLLAPFVTKILPDLPLYKLLALLPKTDSAVSWALSEQGGIWSLTAGE